MHCEKVLCAFQGAKMVHIWVYMAICSHIHMHLHAYTSLKQIYTLYCTCKNIYLYLNTSIYIDLCLYRCILACIWSYPTSTKLKKVVKHCTQAFFCMVLMFYAILRGPSWFFPLVRYKAFEGFLLLLVVYFFGNPAWILLTSVMNVF